MKANYFLRYANACIRSLTSALSNGIRRSAKTKQFLRKSKNASLTLLLSLITLSPVMAGVNYQQKADELLPVDCLLPGAIRKLGGRMTYITQRRPVKTTGVDCEIRGGEYVLYDRASYNTALAIWMPMAESGDPKAQNLVGEIYEKGLGVLPNYLLAAQWYQKAAEQDYSSAQTNLGQLYERGLGVKYDKEKALAWYRKSANIKGKVLKFVSFDYSDEKIAAMEQTINDNAKQSTVQKQRIQHLAQQLDDSNSQKQRAELQLAENQQAVTAEKTKVEKQRKQLETYQSEVAQLRTEMKQQLAAQQAEQSAKPQVSKPSKSKTPEQTAAATDTGFTMPKIVLQFDKKKLAKLRKQLGKTETKLAKLSDQLSTNESELAQRELTLKKKDLQLAELSASYQKIQKDLSSSQSQLGNELAKDTGNTQMLAVNTAPIIEIIEPPLLATRGNDMIIKTRSGTDQRTIIGQVKSSSPLLEVLVNDKAVKVDSKGLFQHRVPLTRSITNVKIVAIDTQGLRADTQFKLELETATPQNLYANGEKSNNPAAPAKIPNVDFGNYHALVIGNSQYSSLPDLDTTIADADAMTDILTDRYGFKVTKLIDATRYDILSALNDLRSKLTEDDNLLIYYAGHGELDEVNSRGHWLPVDAEESSSANWISNIAITDILNAMSVRKVLVVSDSCYSGSMTRSTLARLDAGRSEGAWKNWLKLVAEKRSRLSFSSGGLAPVLDGGGGKHSIFAKALLDALESNNAVIEGRQLHTQVAQAVSYAASAAQFEQAPQYAPIRFAGHESGDFLFVPRR